MKWDGEKTGAVTCDDLDFYKILEQIKTGDLPRWCRLEEAQNMLFRKHDQLKQETMSLIAAATAAAERSCAIEEKPITPPSIGSHPAKAAVDCSTAATILVSKSKTKTGLPLMCTLRLNN